jgi:hypothetical protein
MEDEKMKRYFTSTPGIISVIGILILIGFSVFTIFNPLSAPPSAGISITNKTMPIIVSIIVLLAGLYVILSKKYPDDTQKWAFGVVGLIIGYWLPLSSK